jgi:CheY-like chemotaxis protein
MSSVLVVDDIDVVRLTLRKFLERGGHDVTECASADEAEQAVRRSMPDVVVTDLWMPGRNGLALIGALRERYAHLPVIAISGGAPRLPQAHSLDEARKAGADRLLMKPVSMQELLSSVQDVLSQAKPR